MQHCKACGVAVVEAITPSGGLVTLSQLSGPKRWFLTVNDGTDARPLADQLPPFIEHEKACTRRGFNR